MGGGLAATYLLVTVLRCAVLVLHGAVVPVALSQNLLWLGDKLFVGSPFQLLCVWDCSACMFACVRGLCCCSCGGAFQLMQLW
jgi:hypothetical protein